MVPGEELCPPREERVLDLLAVGAVPGALLFDGAQYYPGLAEAHELYKPLCRVKPPGYAGAGLALGAGGTPLSGAQVVSDVDPAMVNPPVALELPDPVVPGAPGHEAGSVLLLLEACDKEVGAGLQAGGGEMPRKGLKIEES